MKLVINVPDVFLKRWLGGYRLLKLDIDKKGHIKNVTTGSHVKQNCRDLDYAIISEDMTNGQMLKALFPSMEITYPSDPLDNTIHIHVKDLGYYDVDSYWWDSTYRGAEHEGTD